MASHFAESATEYAQFQSLLLFLPLLLLLPFLENGKRKKPGRKLKKIRPWSCFCAKHDFPMGERIMGKGRERLLPLCFVWTGFFSSLSLSLSLSLSPHYASSPSFLPSSISPFSSGGFQLHLFREWTDFIERNRVVAIISLLNWSWIRAGGNHSCAKEGEKKRGHSLSKAGDLRIDERREESLYLQHML